MNPKLEDVFGVRTGPVLSYIKRTAVDDKFQSGLKSDKQIVVYGASKQGKTSLVTAHLPYEKNIVVRADPKSEILDIYLSILRKSDITIRTQSQKGTLQEAHMSGATKVSALIPLLGGGEATAGGDLKGSRSNTDTFEEVPFNLARAQDVSELLNRTAKNKPIILENFHYLDDERQKHFAFDLRTFQELGVRFVILGVWREKNRLAQFNGDLLDRVIEVPVEPWEEDDFRRVAKKGAELLNIDFSDEILNRCIESSFSSIGVFQELLKETCVSAGVIEFERQPTRIEDGRHVDWALRKKADDYAPRHQSALQAIAAGKLSSRGRDGMQPLFLPYYLVRVILESASELLRGGLRRATIRTRIQNMHHRPSGLSDWGLNKLLDTLSAFQSKKSISPPIFDYDKTTKELRIVDSTFYFFLRNADLNRISEELPNPLQT